MRINPEHKPDENGDDDDGHTHFFKSLKNVPDLPEDMLKIVAHGASNLAKSLEKQSAAAQQQLEEDGQPEDDLGIILMPFIMELSFLKIQLASIVDQIADLKQGGDPN